MVTVKEKNILILSMSTLHSNMELFHYYGEGTNGDYRFDGVSQLEAGSKYLLHHLADKGQKIDRIIVLNTCQTRGADATKWEAAQLAPYLYGAESLNAADFYEKRIREYLQFGDKKADIEKNLRDAGVGEELAVEIRDYLTSGMAAFYDVEYSKAKEMIDRAEKDIFNAAFKKYVETRNKMIKEECLHVLEAYTNHSGAESVSLEDVIRNYEVQVANTKGTIEKEKRAISSYIKEYIYAFLDTQDCFKHKKADNRKALKLLYPQVPTGLFKHIFVEYKNADGKYVKDDATVKMLCDDLLELKGTAENLHVYIDSQGGERTFIHTVNAAIDLLSNRNVTVEEIIATDFNRDKLTNKVRFVTKEYAITDLGAGMKAFLRYGKAEELLRYLNKKGLGETANEKKLIDIIKSIDESIQVADPIGLYDNLNELKTHPELLDETSYRDVNIQIVVEDIKRDYAQLLHEDSNIVDVIEWLCKKSLMVQTLTFIEDKIPEYLVGEQQIIRLEHSYESEIAAINKNGWGGGNETRLANGFIKKASGELFEADKNAYMNRVYEVLLRGYIGTYYDKIMSKVDVSSLFAENETNADIRKEQIMSMPVEVLFKKYNADMCLNMQYATFCNKHKVPQYATVGELVSETEKREVGFGRMSIRPDKIFNDTVVAFAVYDTYKKEDKRLYESYVAATDAYIASNKTLENADRETMIRRSIQVLFLPALITIKNNNKGSADAYEQMKLLDVEGKSYFSQVLQSNGNSYFGILRILIEHYQEHINHKEFSVDKYIASHQDMRYEQRLTELYEALSEPLCDAEDAIEKYIEYRDVASDYEHKNMFNLQSGLYENPFFYMEELGEEFLEIYKENSLYIYDENYFYQTVAGLRNANKVGTMKLDAVYIAENVDRRKLEKVLLLHKALKNERNNTNHASERSLRLPLWVVKRIIGSYIGLVREL